MDFSAHESIHIILLNRHVFSKSHDFDPKSTNTSIMKVYFELQRPVKVNIILSHKSAVY